MDRDARLRLFMEDQARMSSLMEDLSWIRRHLERLEFLVTLLVAQIGITILV